MLETDKIIKQAMLSKTNHLENSEETFIKILEGIENLQVRKTLYFNNKKFALAFICVAFLIFGSMLTLSSNARASASEILNSVKSVFLINKSTEIEEVPGDYAFLTPAYSKNTDLNDSDLSRKMGLKISFPQTLNQTFKLERRAEAIGFSKSLDYQTYKKLSNLAVEAVDNNDVFQDLQNYQPYRSVGSVYQNDKGVKVAAVVYNKVIPLQPKNINIVQSIDTKIGDQIGKWINISYPIYPDNDLTQKPIGTASTYMLLWWKGGATYQIWPLTDNSFSKEQTVDFAESLLNVK